MAAGWGTVNAIKQYVVNIPSFLESGHTIKEKVANMASDSFVQYFFFFFFFFF